MALLEISGLKLEFVSRRGITPVLRGIDLSVSRGQILGIVGETGSGKSVTGLSVARLLPSPPARYTAGAIRYDGLDILGLPVRQLRALRGVRIGMVFQDPATNLNPSFRLRSQIVDVGMHVARVAPERLGLPATASRASRRRAVLDLAVAMLEKVGIADAASRIDAYPHQFSGGMRQRVLIAMALLGRPDLLIADEPTTALDVTVQAQVLELLFRLVREFDLAVILITHNMGVVAQLCTDVAVMSDGLIVEQGPVRQVLRQPRHSYTRLLLDAVPTVHGGRSLLAGAGAAP